jgi:hypothetical protein
VCDAFDAFYAEMKTVYSCIVTHLMFDRDPSFNEAFRIHLLKCNVRPDMSGAYDHWEMGSVESYWGAWRSQVVAMLIHGQKDETGGHLPPTWPTMSSIAHHDSPTKDGSPRLNGSPISPRTCLTYAFLSPPHTFYKTVSARLTGRPYRGGL